MTKKRRPGRPATGRQPKVQVSLQRGEMDRLKDIALAESRSVSAIARIAIQEFLRAAEETA